MRRERRGLRVVAFVGVLLAGAALALPAIGARQIADDARAAQAWAEWRGAMRRAHDGYAGESEAMRLPPGHPPVPGADPRLPPGHPPVGAFPQLPPGHPAIGGPGAPDAPASPIFEAPRTLDI
jgi:hypothetical protein